jgi:hypothetical protein
MKKKFCLASMVAVLGLSCALCVWAENPTVLPNGQVSHPNGQSQQSSSTASSSAASAPSATSNGSVAASQRVVMKIGDIQITQTQFDQMYAAFLKDNEGGVAQKAKTVAGNYAGSLMLSKQALAQRLDQDPEVQRRLEMNRIQILSDAEYERLQEQARPTTQEIAAYYQARLRDFDEVDIRRIFVYKQKSTTHGHGLPTAEAQARAEQIYKVLAAGGDAKSMIAGTKDAVDTDPLSFRRGDLPEGLEHAFDMKQSECSQLVETADVFSMFCIVRRGRLSLTNATPLIEKRLQAQKLREEMDALKKKTGIWMDEEYLSGLVASTSSSASSEKRDGTAVVNQQQLRGEQ